MLLVFFIVLSVVAGSLILRCRSALQWRPCPLLYPVVSSASSEPIRAGLSGWCQSPVSACLLHWYCKQGAFVPLTLLSIFTTTPPSAIHNNRLSPSRGVVVRLPDGHRYGPPLVARSINCYACCHHYPGGLPVCSPLAGTGKSDPEIQASIHPHILICYFLQFHPFKLISRRF